jgi:pyruvate,water dikinase
MEHAGDRAWDAPGPGQWYLTRDHFPLPVCRLFAVLFPPTTLGWRTGEQRFGLPDREPRWAAVNSWLYYGPLSGGSADGLENAAAETLHGARWREDVRQWHDVHRPRVIDTNRSLQGEDVTVMDDAELSDHLQRAMDHFLDVGRVHFEHRTAIEVGGGVILEELERWGIDHADIEPLLAGASPASAAAREHVDRIVEALGDRPPPSSIGDIRAAGPDAAAALDAYLADYGWRCLDQHEIRGATLGERLDILVASVRARMAGVGGGSPVPDPEPVRQRVPEDERARFDELLAELRALYGLNDDNVGITWGWPLGIVRRAVLEAGRRLAARRAVYDASHVFEAEPDELLALLRGDGPPADELAARADRTAAAVDLDPPGAIGEPAPSPSADAGAQPSVARLVAAQNRWWAVDARARSEPLTGFGIGDVAYRGRACVVDGEGYLDLEPGDVIVATITHAGHNTVFPIAGAVATEKGGPLSHPAVLARELGLPAVVGASGLMAKVRTGSTVEVDPVAGVVRILD